MTLEEHLKARHIDFVLHRPIIDADNDVATFLLWNLSGKLIGFQQYRRHGVKKAQNDPKLGRYFSYRDKTTVAVWGVESLHLTPNIVFVVEGLFDAARLTERGVSAIALLMSPPQHGVKEWLSLLNRRVIVVCDNDDAGKSLAKLSKDVVVCTDKDLGDSSDEFVDSLVEKYVWN